MCFLTYTRRRDSVKTASVLLSRVSLRFIPINIQKIGFQVCELFDEESLREKLARVLEVKNIIIKDVYGNEPLSFDDCLAQMLKWRDEIEPYVGNTHAFLRDAERAGKTILLEGQLGSLKDTDHGIYPMVTSSSTLAGYGAVGAGLPPYAIKNVITVVKAYSSAVGAGAFCKRNIRRRSIAFKRSRR